MSSQIVLMTGSSAGIGLAIAERLARDPDQRYIVIATVIALSEKAELETVVGDALDRTVFIRKMDITLEEDVDEVVDDVIKQYGRIDVLLNIAGIIFVGVVERFSRAKVDQIFQVNTIGTICLTQKVLPHMKQRRAGKIITINSRSGRVGMPYGDLYSATKFALEGFFESLAPTTRAFNIRLCLIEPSTVHTQMYYEVKDQLESQSVVEAIEDIDRRQLQRLVKLNKQPPALTPTDIADVVIGRCLDVDDPIFRHLVVEENAKDSALRSLSDLTGETGIATLYECFAEENS